MDPHQKMKAAKMVTMSIYARIFSYYLQSFKRELTIQTKINNVMQGYKKYESKMCNNNSIKIRRDKVKISLFRQHDFICRKSNEIYLKKKWLIHSDPRIERIQETQDKCSSSARSG